MGFVVILSIVLVAALVAAIALYLCQPRQLQIATEVEDQRAVASLHGRVTIGGGDVKLRNAIQDLLDQGVRNIVIDLRDVTRIDSSGMGELVAAHMAVASRGGTLELRGLKLPIFPDFPDFPDGFAF